VWCPASSQEIAMMPEVQQIARDLLNASEANGNIEYGAHIIQTSAGSFEAVNVRRGYIGGVVLPDAPDNAIAEIHTHPDQAGLRYEFPSSADASRVRKHTSTVLL
jgi:hypothetical protein